MKFVTICGSMKYQNEMIKIARNLETKFGYCVLQCVYDFGGENINKQEKDKIAKAHMKKIALSDYIYVVNIDGYIGESTQKEIDYAIKHDKEVFYHEPLKEDKKW